MLSGTTSEYQAEHNIFILLFDPLLKYKLNAALGFVKISARSARLSWLCSGFSLPLPKPKGQSYQ